MIGRLLGYSVPSTGLSSVSFDLRFLQVSVGLVTQLTLAGRLEIPLASVDPSVAGVRHKHSSVARLLDPEFYPCPGGTRPALRLKG